jgi:hypothetical protein
VFLQKCSEFFLESHFAVMNLLAGNIGNDGILQRLANRKRTVSGLPAPRSSAPSGQVAFCIDIQGRKLSALAESCHPFGISPTGPYGTDLASTISRHFKQLDDYDSSAANTARAQFSSVTNPLIQWPRNAPKTAFDLSSPPAKAITGFLEGRGNWMLVTRS